MNRRQWFRNVLGGTLTAPALAHARGASGMRYVEFNIYLDRRLVLRTSVGDSGSEEEHTVWKYLYHLPLRSMHGYAVKPGQNSPLRATLKGRATIRALGGEVSLDGLHLVRSTPSARWLIDPKDVRKALSKRTPTSK